MALPFRRALLISSLSLALITGLNLFPYIRLGPRWMGKGVCLTAWLSGSGGIGETHSIFTQYLANRRSRERRSRCPLEPVLARMIVFMMKSLAHASPVR
jgi:hypothetical protein